MDACANCVYSEKDSLMLVDILADRVEHYSSALETVMLNSRGQCKFLVPLAGLQLVANCGSNCFCIYILRIHKSFLFCFQTHLGSTPPGSPPKS